MPRSFEECLAKRTHRVRTVKPSAATHMPVCFDDEGSHAGEVKKTKGYAAGGRVTRDGIGRLRPRLPEGAE